MTVFMVAALAIALMGAALWGREFISLVIPPTNTTKYPPIDGTIVHHLPGDNTWGYAINWDHRPGDTNWMGDDGYYPINGHFPRDLMEIGSLFSSDMNSGMVAVFQVVELRWMTDPADQFSGKARFVGYKKDRPELFDPYDTDITDERRASV